MNGLKLQAKVRKGYRISAAKIGTPHQHYRPLPNVAALDVTCLQGTLPAAFDVNNYRFSVAQSYASAVWTGLWNPDSTQVGDYLVGTDIWFIASQDPILPMQVIRCNTSLTLTDQIPILEFGASSSYSGSRRSRETTTALSYPCSLLMGAGGSPSDTKLPSEPATDEGVMVLLPVLPDVQIVTGQFLTDGRGIRFIVDAVEESDKGWRIRASRKGP